MRKYIYQYTGIDGVSSAEYIADKRLTLEEVFNAISEKVDLNCTLLHVEYVCEVNLN